jgi:hypothetical protein
VIARQLAVTAVVCRLDTGTVLARRPGDNNEKASREARKVEFTSHEAVQNDR